VTGGERRVGKVVAFDEQVGLGEVEEASAAGCHSGPLRYGFHCTQIADGSRRVDVGTEVSFQVVAARGGRWEAGDLRPRGEDPRAEYAAGPDLSRR
jgi:hypothetical protein